MTAIETAKPRPSGSERSSSHQVLVVDDEPGIRHLASRILVDEGYLVQEAGDGLEALNIIQRGQVMIDAVLSDIVMPRLNGVELLQALARTHPALPIVLMSGYGGEELTRRGIASPCAVLSKPFPPERLVAEVRRCIAERR
jgi:two-component system, cell cycle sensor histidine kinase and response regulator CckA